jgi:hypothetical protein
MRESMARGRACFAVLSYDSGDRTHGSGSSLREREREKEGDVI